MQLYLNTYGIYLHVKDDLFEVRLPQKNKVSEKKHFAAHKVTSIILTTSAALSTDAIILALRNNIDIIFTDWNGFPLGRVWHSKLGSTTRIRKRQLEASLGNEAVQWTIRWLSQKLDAQLSLLKDLKKHRKKMHVFLEEKIEKINNLKQSILLQIDVAAIDQIAGTLRGLEGTAGRLYFASLNACLPQADQFKGRSFRPAHDPFNAFLNYGYGVLYSKIEKALMIAGLDPYVGFLHRDDYNQKSMVFDFIEPYRPWIDKVVFQLFSRKKVTLDHTQKSANGISLDKAGKELLIAHLNDFLEIKTIRYKGRNQTRNNSLQMDAHHFANILLGKAEQNNKKTQKHTL